MDCRLVREARADMQDVATWWRVRYELPPTDPRFLDATEEEILRDLLLWRMIEDERNPDRAVDELARDPDAAADLQERGEAFLADEATQRALRLLTGRGTMPETITSLRRRR